MKICSNLAQKQNLGQKWDRKIQKEQLQSSMLMVG